MGEMKMLERVAREIAAADGEDYMEDSQRYDARARAAIEAMREPDDLMVRACLAKWIEQRKRMTITDASGDLRWPNWETEQYQAMIDAALKDTTDE